MKLLDYLKKALLFTVKYVLSRAILLILFVGLFIGMAQMGYSFLTYMKSPMIQTENSVFIDVKPFPLLFFTNFECMGFQEEI